MKILLVVIQGLFLCSCCVPVSKSWTTGHDKGVTNSQFAGVSKELGYRVEDNSRSFSGDRYLSFNGDGSLIHGALLCPGFLESLFYGVGFDFKMQVFEKDESKLLKWFKQRDVILERQGVRQSAPTAMDRR